MYTLLFSFKDEEMIKFYISYKPGTDIECR